MDYQTDALVGTSAIDFSLISDQGSAVTLSQFKGKKIVLYFYPKDLTSGCTTQACDFRNFLQEHSSNNIVVLGVSKDVPSTHVKFKEKHDLNFSLLSDVDGTICEQYGVWKEKSMYGKKYFGIERSTFLINENFKIQSVWRKVKVPGHVTQVMNLINC
jgi:peroxiredoxin Q/BCP